MPQATIAKTGAIETFLRILIILIDFLSLPAILVDYQTVKK